MSHVPFQITELHIFTFSVDTVSCVEYSFCVKEFKKTTILL